MTNLTVQKVTNDALKRAAVMRRRIDFLRHSLFWVCGIVRRRNQNAHIAGDKCGARAARVVRRGYIYKYIYGALRPPIY